MLDSRQKEKWSNKVQLRRRSKLFEVHKRWGLSVLRKFKALGYDMPSVTKFRICDKLFVQTQLLRH